MALKSARGKKDVNKDQIIDRVTQAARSAIFRNQDQQKHPKPYASQIRGELIKFSKAGLHLIEAIIGLSSEACRVLDDGLKNYYFPKEKCTPSEDFVRNSLLLLYSFPNPSKEHLGLAVLTTVAAEQADRLQPGLTHKLDVSPTKDILSQEIRQFIKQTGSGKTQSSLGFPQRGARRNEALEYFGIALATIFFEFTNRLPRANFNAIKDQPSGPFYHFVVTSLKPTGLLTRRQSPVALVKKICKIFSPPTKARH